jgi:hypothetical protein
VSWAAARQTAADLEVDRSAIAIMCRRSSTWDGLATAWIDPTAWARDDGSPRPARAEPPAQSSNDSLSGPANYRRVICALLTTKLLQDLVEVAVEDGMLGWLGSTVVGSDMPYPSAPAQWQGGSSRGLAEQRWLQDHPEDKISSSILQDGGRYGPVGSLEGACASRDGQDVGCSGN